MIVNYATDENKLPPGTKLILDGKEVYEAWYIDTEKGIVKTYDIHQTGQRARGEGSAAVTCQGYNPKDYPEEYDLEYTEPELPLSRTLRGKDLRLIPPVSE